MPMRSRPAGAERADYFGRLGRFVVSNRVILLCSFAVLAVALMAGMSRIALKENWLELLGENYEFRRFHRFHKREFHWR